MANKFNDIKDRYSDNATRRRWLTHPRQLLPLLLRLLLLPLLLHVLQELQAVHQEVAALLALPHINLGFQLLFQLESRRARGITLESDAGASDWRRLFTLGRLLCSSDLCFSSLRRFPPLLVNLAGSVAFFCEKNKQKQRETDRGFTRLCSGNGESEALFGPSTCFGREHFCKNVTNKM